MSESKLSVEAIFDAAVQFPRDQREAYLREACAGDDALRERVAALLHSHSSAGTFMEDPAAPRPEPAASPAAAPAAPRGTIALKFAEPPDDATGQTIGRYKLLEKVGEGGCGVVYVAEQTEPVRRRVALKVIKLGMDTKQVIARFEAERQALAMMDHPNIAKVLDAGATETGRPYFVMELVRGIPITHYCDQASLNTKARLELFVKVCQAIQHAHQKGIIHRDIKPSNVLVTVNDGAPVPKVIDFGIAKAIEGRLTEHTVYTQLNQFIGTPAYMSPEQAEMTSLDIDTRSDIYSLGVLLYEMLAGSTPFTAKELMARGLEAMRKIIREKEPPRPSTRFSTMSGEESSTTTKRRATETAKLVRQLKGDLDWIVMKCLEKDRTRRYETANGLAADLARHLRDEPVVAGPPSTGYRIAKFVRRNRGKVAAGAVVALALLFGITGTFWGLMKAKHRLAQTQKANEILGSIFDHLNPQDTAEDAKRPLRAILAEKLDQAVTQLEGQSIGEPLQVAAMQQKFARSLFGLGQGQKATVLLERALATRTAILGPDHPDTLLNRIRLSDIADAPSEREVAFAEATCELAKKRLGSDHPITIEAMTTLGSSYLGAGKYDQGESLLEETLKLSRSRLGLEDTRTLHAMKTLASTYQRNDKTTLALSLLEETLKLERAKFGSNDLAALGTLGTLGDAYARDGKPELGVPLLEERLKRLRDLLGFEHPVTIEASLHLADGYGLARKWDKAITMFKETINLMKIRRGPDHPNTLVAEINLCRVYLQSYGAIQGVSLAEETVKLMRTKFPAQHPTMVNAMYILAGIYEGVCDYEMAATLLEEIVKLKAVSLDPQRFDAAISLARDYECKGQLDKSAVLREETIKLLKTALGSDDPKTCQTRNELADFYKRNGKEAQSVELYEENQRLTKAKFGPDNEARQAATLSLAISYRDSGRLDEAIPLWLELLANAPSTITADNYLSLIRTLVERGRFAAALPAVQATQKTSHSGLFRRTIALWKAVVEAETAPGKTEPGAPTLPRTLAWARLAQSLAGGPGGLTNLTGMVEAAAAEAQRAVEVDPKQPDAWNALGIFQWLRHDLAASFASLDRGLGLRPDDESAWEVKASILEREGHAEAALDAYAHWIALLPATNMGPCSVRNWALGKHAALCREIGRWTEAAADIRSFGIPAREPGTAAQLVDLSAFYNATFKGDWMDDLTPGNDLAELPTGIQLLAGSQFDVRGLAQLRGTREAVGRFPNQLAAIPVGVKGKRIRFLQGLSHDEERFGTVIGRYVLHFKNGKVSEHQVVLGGNVLDWWDQLSMPGAGRPIVGWSGGNESVRAAERFNPQIHLYLTTWENPSPDEEIVSLDFVSAGKAASPFLVAVTVE